MTLEKEVQTLDERLSAAGYKDKAPAAVVEKAEAELSDKRLQFKTVSDSIESMLAQVPKIKTVCHASSDHFTRVLMLLDTSATIYQSTCV